MSCEFLIRGNSPDSSCDGECSLQLDCECSECPVFKRDAELKQVKNELADTRAAWISSSAANAKLSNENSWLERALADIRATVDEINLCNVPEELRKAITRIQSRISPSLLTRVREEEMRRAHNHAPNGDGMDLPHEVDKI